MTTKELKQLRKAAFAIGFGFTIGKFAADWAGTVIDGAIEGTMKGIASCSAKNGNKRMQELCEEYNVEYEKNKTTDKVIIGFHA